MTLLEAIQIYGGGPGSGCRGENCGRKGGGAKLSGLSDRARRAVQTYVPVTEEKYQMAKLSERKVANVLGGISTDDNEPFDVVINNRIGVEVKTIIEARNNKITVHPDAMKEKLAEQSRLKLDAVYTVIFDQRPGQEAVYVRKGLGSFRVPGKLTKLQKISDLKKFVV